VSRAALACASLLLAVACKKPAPSPSQTAPDPLAPAGVGSAIALPASTADDRPDGGARLYATKEGLFLDDQRVAGAPRAGEGFPAKDKLTAGGLEIPELSRRAKGLRDVLVYVDASLSSRALVEIVFSLKLAEVQRAALMTRGSAGVRAIPLDMARVKRRCVLPPPVPGAPAPSASTVPSVLPEGCESLLELSVVQTPTGEIAFFRGTHLGEGCTAPGTGMSVKGLDAAALGACFAAIRERAPKAEGDRAVTVAPLDEVTVADLAKLLDLLRGGAKPFTSLRIGAI
jgi:hypothetical protein